MRSRSVLACAVALLGAALAACSEPMPGGDVTRPDATDVARPDVTDDLPMGERCMSDSECSDGMFCTGEERCVSGVCQMGTPPCDDRYSCTMDSCDEAAHMCTHTPDDSMCGDMNACNGVEHCNPSAPGVMPATGCEPVNPDNILDCDDGNTCTVDTCDPGFAGGCVHSPRDLDGDGHIDRACTIDATPSGIPGDDCNDGDPAVYPGAPEVCNDGRDNNCDGRTDYADPMCLPTNDACGTATVLPGPGTYTGSTVSLRRDYTVSCGTAADGADAVFEFTTTMPQDVTATVTGGSDFNSSVTLIGSCSPLSEMRCSHGTFGTSPSMRYRGLPAGTYRLIVSVGTGAAFRLTLRYDPASPPTPTYTLSTSPAGVAFINICTMSTSRVLASTDDGQASIPLTSVPFPLRMYGNAVTTDLTVSSNGWLSLQSVPGFPSLSGTVPNPSDPNLTIAPLWADLVTRTNGVCYGVTGTAPNRKFVIQWDDAQQFASSAAHLTFEIILNEQASGTGNNYIDVVYNTITSFTATPGMGIENEDGTVGTVIPAPASAPRIVRFTPSL